jgi:DNA-binding CsgD family transcriptional regulator
VVLVAGRSRLAARLLEQHDNAVTRYAVARAETPVARLAHVTGGELARNDRWARCVQPRGMGDLLVWACRDAHGCWGWLEALRADDRAPFSDQDAALLATLSEPFGRALRYRAAPPATLSSAPRPPSVLVLDGELRLASWSPTTHEWLTDLPGGATTESGLLPSVIYSVAGRATAPANAADLAAHAVLPTVAGSWAVVEGAPLHGAPPDRVAVTIRDAEPTEVAFRLAPTYQLTAREQQLATLAAGGLSTHEIANRLYLSPYTVKDHFKAIFTKTGTHSRRELTVMLAGGTRGTTAPVKRAACRQPNTR